MSDQSPATKPVITVIQFTQLIGNKAVIEQGTETHDDVTVDDYEADEDNELRKIERTTCSGLIYRTLRAPGLEVVYQEYYEYPKHKPILAQTSTEGLDAVMVVNRMDFDVVGNDGELLDDCELSELMTTHTDIDIFDHEQAFGENAVTEIDLEGKRLDEGCVHEVECDNAPNLRFRGLEVATVSTSPDRGNSDFSGSTGRYKVLKLWKTVNGKYIAQEIGRTQWMGERDRFKAAVCADHAAVIAFFGHGKLAKDLYAEAGITDAVTVD